MSGAFQKRLVGFVIERTDRNGNKICTRIDADSLNECCDEEGGSEGSNPPALIEGGPTCDEATPVTLETAYTAFHPGGLVEHWYVFFIPTVPGFYRIKINTEHPERLVQVLAGGSCEDAIEVYGGNTLALCIDYANFSPTTDLLWIKMGNHIVPQPAGGYDFIVEQDVAC